LSTPFGPRHIAHVALRAFDRRHTLAEIDASVGPGRRRWRRSRRKSTSRAPCRARPARGARWT